MKHKITLVFILVLIFSGCAEKSESVSLNDCYFDSSPPGDTAIVFAPGIVSTDQHEHSRITFSKDGTEMFWSVIPVKSNYIETGGRPFKPDEQNIWHSKIINNEWSKPVILNITKPSGYSSPAFSVNGDIFYFKTRTSDAGPNIEPKPDQLWKVTYDREEGWGAPIQENELINIQVKKTFMSFCFADNNNLYFDYGSPDETGEWYWNIYFSEFKNSRYLPPVKLESGINDGELSWCPWIAPDESYLIYSSHRDGEYGNGDLYINFKDEEGNWSNAINMGKKVNTSKQERFPSVSPNGKFLFFAKHIHETFSDIFWVDAKIIEELRSYK
ncbi:MAG: hypothetical protein PVF17_01835 [Ignavibacteria bacterium]|jgi:hypothetical protein